MCSGRRAIPRWPKKTLPSPRNPETYSLAAVSLSDRASASMDDADSPFVSSFRIPLDIARQQPFFQRQYWNDAEWRRVDSDYLGDATELAIALDNMTNNTSLVLAIELVDSGDVLLFAADAQVGNWLSWQRCSWQVGNETVTGTDLLKRTVFYKVGHHGSLNATLKEKGIQLMERLKSRSVPSIMKWRSRRGGDSFHFLRSSPRWRPRRAPAVLFCEPMWTRRRRRTGSPPPRSISKCDLKRAVAPILRVTQEPAADTSSGTRVNSRPRDRNRRR